MANLYISSVGYTAVTQWSAGMAMTVGVICRQKTVPAASLQRCFRCTVAGTGNVAGGVEPTWVTTVGGTTSDNTGTWTEITGQETFQGTSWAAPHPFVANALVTGWSAAGDTYFIDSAHAETQAAAVTLTFPGTGTSRNNILSVVRPSSAIPPANVDLTVGATITTTGTNVLAVNGSLYAYGITISSGTGSTAAAWSLGNAGATATTQVWDTCTFKNATTASGPSLICGASPSAAMRFLWKNCTANFAAVGQHLSVRNGAQWHWWGGSITGSAPTQLLAGNNGQSTYTDIRDVDLSLMGAGKNLVSMSNITIPSVYSFANCLVNAAVSVTTGAIAVGNDASVDFVLSDSASAVTREEHYRHQGSIVQDTTNTRNSGASDGTTSKSWKMVSLANSGIPDPLAAPDIVLWNSLTGSRTITLFVANTTGTLNNNDMGFEIEYLGSAGSPKGTYASTLPSVLATASALTTDASTWAGLVSPTVQKIALTVTINLAGPLRIRPVLAKASATVWVDPLVSIA